MKRFLLLQAQFREYKDHIIELENDPVNVALGILRICVAHNRHVTGFDTVRRLLCSVRCLYHTNKEVQQSGLQGLRDFFFDVELGEPFAFATVTADAADDNWTSIFYK